MTTGGSIVTYTCGLKLACFVDARQRKACTACNQRVGAAELSCVHAGCCWSCVYMFKPILGVLQCAVYDSEIGLVL